MISTGPHSKEFRFKPGSWATLLLALGFIASAGLYLILAFKHPTDGQVYETRLDGQLIVVNSPLGDSGPLVPGDKLLAIEGIPATTTDIQFIARPPGWQIGGVAQYLVQRGDSKAVVQAQTRKLMRRQPAMKLFMLNPLSRFVMDWYFMRLMITVYPYKIQWWAAGDFSQTPQVMEVEHVV
jgi:hypothetical protein